MGGSFWTTRERIAAGGRCEAVEAVQAARPVNGDTSRTSVSEGEAGEEELLDIAQDGAGAPLCQKYNLANGLVHHEIQVLGTLDIKFVGRTSRGHTGGRSHRIFHPPSFCGACLNFSREKDSAIPFPRRP